MEKRNTDSQWSKQEACFACATQVWNAAITTPVSHLANEFDIRSELDKVEALQLSVKFCVVHEAMNGCKILT